MAAPRPNAHRLARPAASTQPWPLKPVCLAVLGMAAWIGMPTAWALPDGGVPTHGQAQLHATGDGTLTIRQTSAQAGFDWRSFSIAAGERVQVLQPDARSILFNRVTGADPSLILGQLQANGRVFLSNPRGIVFGAGAQVDVGGLLATTLTMNRSAGADGRWQLGGGDAATGVLRMDGNIRAPDGMVALVGPQLSVGGNVLAGRLGLAAAGAVQVDVDGDGLIFFNLRDEHLAARLQLLPDAHLLARSAELRAAARSQFADTVLNLEGVVRARGLAQQGAQVVIGGAAPQILVDGGATGITRVAGRLDASATGPGETGGQVRVLGDRVWIDGSARLDARGDAGGGLLHVGGAWQGQGPGRNALHTRVAAGAQLDASAIRLGDGGQVVVWADGSTVFDGAIRARGGLLGGDGGAVETSGKLQLGIGSGSVDAGAAPGFRAGRWLLDPLNIIVSDAAAASAVDPTVGWQDGTALETLSIRPAALKTDNTDVSLQARQDVTIDSVVALNTGQSFTAEAGRHVIVTSSGRVVTQNRPISLRANVDLDVSPANGHDASGIGRVAVSGILDAGTGAIQVSRAGGSGQHLLGNRLTGGSLTLTGPAALAADVSFDLGSLVLDSALALTGNTTITVPGTRSIDINRAIGDAGAPDPGAGLTKLGDGTLTLSGANTYRGGTTVGAGRLQVGADTHLGGAGGISLQGNGTLAWTAGANPQTVSVARSLAVGDGGGTLDVAGTVTVALSGAVTGAGALAKTGAGVLALAQDNTAYTAGVALTAGTLRLDHAAALAGSVVTLGTVQANAPVLAVAVGSRVAALAGGSATAGDVRLANGTVLTTGAAGSSYSGKISLDGATGTLVKAGVGNFTLDGATGFTGATQVNAGTLTLGHATALAGSMVTLGTEQDNAPVLAVAVGSRIAALAGGSVDAGDVRLDNGTVLTTGSTTSTYTGKLSLAGATGTLLKAGSGTFTLDGATGFTGATQVDGGTLTLNHANALQGSSITLGLAAANTLDVLRTSTVAALAGGGANSTVQLATGATLHTGAVDSSYAGTTSGGGALRVDGGAVFTVQGIHSHTGGTQVAAGTLRLAPGSAALPAERAVSVSGGVLDLNGQAASIGVLEMTGGEVTAGTLAAGSFVLQAGRIDADLQGGAAGGLRKLGSGQVDLTGSNSYTGPTTVSAGTLVLTGPAALPGGTTLTVDGTGSLDLGGTTRTTTGIFTLDTAGSMRNGVLQAGLFRLQAGSVDASISGSASLLKQTGGTVALNQASPGFTGSVTVLGGTLALNAAGALQPVNPVALDTVTGATLAVQASNNVQSLAGGAAATVEIDGGRSLTIGSAGSAADSNFSGRITGAGALVKQGDGSLTLAGSNSFDGGTTVAAGTLVAAGGAALHDTGAVQVDSGATLQLAASETVGALAGAGAVALGTSALTVNTSADTSFTGTITDSDGRGSLVKQGDGRLTLAGSNNFGGSTTVARGTLLLANGGALGDNAALQVDSGATLQLLAGETVGALSGAGAVALGDHRLTVGSADNTEFSGRITGTGNGSLVKQGSGRFTLSGDNSFGGGTTVAAGTLVLANGSALADTGALQLDSAATLRLATSETVGALTGLGTVDLGTRELTVDVAAATSFGGNIGGAGSLAKRGVGTLTLTGTNTQLGGTLLRAGALVVDDDIRLGGAGASLTLDGGTLRVTDGHQVVLPDSRPVVVAAGGGVLATTDAAMLTVQGRISGSGPLAKQGPGSLHLEGDNRGYDGDLALQGGSLRASRGEALSDTGALLMDPGTTLAIDSREVLGQLGGSGSVSLAAGSQLRIGTADPSSFGGSFSGAGGLVKQGTGTLTLTGASSHTGGTEVRGGALAVTADANLGDSLGALTLDGGRLRLVGNTVVQLSASRGLVLGTAGGTLDVQAAGAQLQVLGPLIGSSRLTKDGAGSLRLLGSSAGFTGSVAIDGGSLHLGGGQALPSATLLTLASGSLLQIDSSQQLGQIAGLGTVGLGDGVLLHLGDAGNFSFGGSFSGGGALAKLGSGAFTLAGANGHEGGTSVLEGSLVVSRDDQLGAAGRAVTLSGGAVLATTGASTVALAASRNLVLGAGGGVLQTTDTAGLALAGRLSGNSTLTKQGAGALVLAGDNSAFSGALALQAGSLNLQHALALGAGNALHLEAGTLLGVAQGVSVGSLSGLGSAMLAANATLSTGFASSRFDGVLGGAGGLQKLGGGTLTLAGSNQHGSTRLQSGTLQLLGGAALPDGAPVVMAGGTLQVDASEQIGALSGTGAVALATGRVLAIGHAGDAGSNTVFAGSFSGGGALVKQGPGTLALTGASSHGGGTTIAAGVLAVQADAALGAATGVLTLNGGSLRATGATPIVLAGQRTVAVVGAGGTLDVDAGTTLQLAGPLTGNGRLAKAGAGSLALAGASPAFSGAVAVQAGSLALQHAQALGAANAVGLGAGTTLDLAADMRLGPLSGSGAVQLRGFTLATGGADSIFSGTLAGGGVLQQLGGGQLTLNAATGFTGSTQVLGGTLALAHADALTGSPVSVAPAATLAVQASSRIQSLAQPGATGGQVVLADGATLSTGGSADTLFAGSIRGDGALRKLGSGQFTLTGSNSYSGGTQVDAGTLQGDSRSLQGDFSVAGTLVFDQAAIGDVGIFGGRVDGAGSLVKQGSGALQLTGAHQHGGGTQVLAGRLQLAGGQAVPDGGAVHLAAGTTLQVDASETLARLSGTGLLQLQPGTSLTLGDATNIRFDGALAGSGTLVKQGSGQLVLGGASGHAGATLVQAGSLALAAPDLLAASTVTLAGQPGVELRLLDNTRIGALASTDGPAAPAVVLGGFSLATGGNGDSSRFAGSTQGRGSLVKQGGGTLTLAGSNAHTGGTRVQGGSLALQGAQALSVSSLVQLDAGANLLLLADQTIGALTGGGGVQLGGFQLATVVPGDSLFSGQISGSGVLTKRGAGRLTLAGANSFDGAVDLQQGTLALVGGAALGDGVAVQLAAGSRLVADGSETLGALAGDGDVLLQAGTLTTTTADGNHLLAGRLSGPGRLAKAGAGSLTLAGANSHTGGLALLGGSLVVAADSALGAVPDAANPASLLFDGGTLRASSSFTLAAGRSLVLQGAGGTLSVDAGHTLGLPATLVDGSSAGTLAKAGDGTLAFTAGADSSRSGATLVQAGQLTLQRDGQLGTPAGALVLDGGTLQVDQALRLQGTRALQLGAAGGTLRVAAGATLQLGGLVADSAGASVGTPGGALTKTGAGSLVFDGADDNSFTGATRLLGGSLVIQRDGQLGAAPAAATPGQLLIDGATLQIDGDTVLAASRGLALGSGGATLQVATGSVVGLAGQLADAAGVGGGTLVKAGGGLLRLQGTAANLHTGATQVLAGTLALAADGQLGAAPAAPTPGHLLLDGGTLLAGGSFTLAARRGLQLGPAGGTLDVAAGQQLAYGGVLAGSSASPAEGILTKAGGGRLLLDGAAANAHAGATHLLAGTLAISRDDQLGAAPASATPGHLLLDGGTLEIGASTTLAAHRGIALGLQGGVLDVARGASVAFDGVLADVSGLAAGTAGGIDKAGAGTLVLGGVSSHTGTTRVLAGTLATSAAQRLPQAGALQLSNGASLVLGGDQALAALGDGPNPGGVPADATALVDLGAFILRLDTGDGDGRSFYSGAFTGSGGQLLKQGGGTLQLAGGGVGGNLVTVDAGLLVSLGSNSLSSAAAVTVAPGAALQLMAPVTVQSLDLSGRLSGPGRLTASASIDLRDAVVDTTLATAMLRSHGGSLVNAAVQADASLLTGGVLTLGDTGSLQTNTLTLQGGATLATQVAGQLRGLPAVVVDTGRLQLAGAEQVASLGLAGTLAGPGSLGVAGATLLQGASVLTGLATDTLRSTGSNAIDAAVLARRSASLAGGSLVLGGGGSLATPLLTLEAGTLATGNGSGLSTDSRLVVQRPATLLLGADQRLASLDLAGTLGAAPAAAAAGGAAAVASAETGQQRALADPSPAAAAPQLLVDGAVVLDGATVYTPLAATTVTSSGSTTLAAPVLASAGTTVSGGLLSVSASGQLTTPSLQVQAGGVATGAAQGIQAGAQVALAAGTTLQLGGDQVLARLVDLGATGAGAAPAQVQLGSFRLSAGADGADAVFSGQFSGAGTLAKQGVGTWLLRSDQGHGDTVIEAGTLQLGDDSRRSGGGTPSSGGSLGRGAVVNQGLLRFDRADAVQLSQAISGSGSLQQAGSGSLTITSSGLSYTGDTVVSAGSLRTDGADRLPDASHLRLATGARLATGGDDRLGAITADGAVSLGGSLASTGHQVYGGPVSITATAPVTLSAPLARIEALHAGNQWGAQPLSVDAGQLLLGAGRAGAAADAAWNNLALGQVTLRGLADGGAGALPATSQIDAGQLQIGAAVAAGAAATGDARLDGQLNLLAGSLVLRARAAPVYQVPVPAPGDVAAVDPLRGREIALADDVLWQNPHSLVRTLAGASLQLQATAGASIRLDQTGNRFDGAVSALSGASFDTAWKAVDLGGLAGQSVIRLSGQVLQVGGGGVEADVLRFTVGKLATDATSPLVARLWYNDATFGQQRSTPGLQITLLPEALATPASLGSADRPLQVRVGGLATGARTEGLNAGYVQLLPKRAAGGGVAVFLAGPKVGETAYRFFQDGAGDLSEVPLFYNNVLPATPQLAGSLSAVASVSETARRERFDETVRTENVAIRLRAGVIAEVGPGRPATQGSQGLRLPSSCSIVGNLLGCAGVP